MLKGVGMACVLVGAVALGVQCVRRRQLEQAQLRQFFTAFYGMERELRCRSPDLGELLEQASRQTGGSSSKPVRRRSVSWMPTPLTKFGRNS